MTFKVIRKCVHIQHKHLRTHISIDKTSTVMSRIVITMHVHVLLLYRPLQYLNAMLMCTLVKCVSQC